MGPGSECATSAKVSPLQKLIVLLPTASCHMFACREPELSELVLLSLCFSTLSPDNSSRFHRSQDEEHKRFHGEEQVKVALCA